MSAFNPSLRDAEQRPVIAPSRGAIQRPDFRKPENAVDPGAIVAETQARVDAAAERRSQAIERDQSVRGAGLAPSGDSRLVALERRVQSLEADAIVMRSRLAKLEASLPRKARVSAIRHTDSDPPAAA